MPVLKHAKPLLAAAFALALHGFAAEGWDVQSADCGWCAISCPEEVSPGVKFEVKVDLKGLQAKTKLRVDLHWMKADGSYGGFLSGSGEARDVDKDEPQAFQCKFNAREGLGTVHAIAYLSPTGDWKGKTAHARGPDMRMKGGAKGLERPPKGIAFTKSWMHIPGDVEGVYKEGDEFELKLDYFLDPSETWGSGASVMLIPLGPWIDNPDGKYSKSRAHINYDWARMQTVKVEPGEGSLKFKFKVGQLFKYNSLFFLARFKGADGKAWPWHVRGGKVALAFQDKLYGLSTGRPGGLFTYDEPVAVRVKFGPDAVKGEAKILKYSVWNASGAEAGSGSFQFASGAPGEFVEFKPEVKSRGTFVLEGEVEGWGKREVLFARIPDVLKATGGAKIPFGAHDLRTDADCQIARMIGLYSSCRQFFSWYSVQPARNKWDFSYWDKVIDTNRRHGIEPYLCIYDPPQWATGLGKDLSFEPFPFDETAWRESVRVMSERWKDKILGWEWLNEILPRDKSGDPIGDYLKLCRIGTESAKQVNPKFITLLAGGLWPRNFRNDLLKAGIGAYVDVLPVHYSDMGGVMDAKEDLALAGLPNVAVWDDESGSGLSTWGMPAREIIQVKSQSQWALDRWPDELLAGARMINVFSFGSECSPCGNWSCMLDEETPRPYAATIAVLTSKLGLSKPVGKFFLGNAATFHLFERDGKAILLASSSAKDGERVSLCAGSSKALVTDYQGNESVLDSAGGSLSLPLERMRVFVEDADLDVLKAYVTLSVGTDRAPVPYPKAMLIEGFGSKIPIRVRNPYAVPLEGSVSLLPPDGWPSPQALDFSVAPGREEAFEIPLVLPEGVSSGDFKLQAVASFKDARLPKVEKPFGIAIVSPEMMGNLLENGGFETPDGSESKAASWSGDGKRAPSNGSLGLGSSVLRFENAPDWRHMSQTLQIPGGQSYLYSAWVWNGGMLAGSNVSQLLSDGTKKDFYIPHVFSAGTDSPSWRFLAMRTDVPPNVKGVSFVPVVKGSGWAMYDNMRVSIYEGTNYAAEAWKAKSAPKIDGSLDDWDKSCPIPLLCVNQLAVFDKSYKWTPENLSGVAYLMWDAKGLYFAAEVKDDVQSAKATGEDALSGDSIALAIHPENRAAAGNDGKAFVYYISQASPGGGSGLNTLYRPPSKSGGLSSGQLAKDSSVYELSIRRDGAATVYELRLPWSELGGINPSFGSKFGLSIVLNDSDGAGRMAAMSWGDGLLNAWSPANFGVATLVDKR